MLVVFLTVLCFFLAVCLISFWFQHQVTTWVTCMILVSVFWGQCPKIVVWSFKWNRPREQHEVEAVCPVPLRFVKGRSLFHQVFQVSGIHLQPSDHIIHVALIFLVMYFTEGQEEEQREAKEGKQHYLSLKRTLNMCLMSQSFCKLNMKSLLISHLCRQQESKNNKRQRLPDDFPQKVFYLLKVRSFFWILIPTAFYQHVHLET